MPMIFGRPPTGESRVLADVCEEILSDPRFKDNDRTFAWNMMHDHRVNPDWAEKWHRAHRSPKSPAALLGELNKYQGEFRDHHVDTWADLADYGGNTVIPGSAGTPSDGDSLVAVLNLWSFPFRRIWEYAYDRFGLGRIVSASGVDVASAEFPRGLAAALSAPTIDGQLPVMRVFFEAMTAYLAECDKKLASRDPVPSFGPFWVTLWDPWRARVTDSPEEWCDSVGVSKPPSSWLLVVKYPVRRAKRLYRPTQLEACVFGRHFPSPPSCHVSRGGRVVEGRKSVFAAAGFEPLPEFIHAPIALSPSDWIVTKFTVQKTSAYSGLEDNLLRDRYGHWNALDRTFFDLRAWMTQANP